MFSSVSVTGVWRNEGLVPNFELFVAKFLSTDSQKDLSRDVTIYEKKYFLFVNTCITDVRRGPLFRRMKDSGRLRNLTFVLVNITLRFSLHGPNSQK